MHHTDKCKHYIQRIPQTAVTVPQYTKSSISTSHNTIEAEQATGAGAEGPTGATGSDPGKTTGTVQHRYVKIVGEPQTTPDKSVEP